jgi:TonB family protein
MMYVCFVNQTAAIAKGFFHRFIEKSKLKHLITLFFSFFCIAAFCQKQQNIYYLKNDGREVSIKDSADYIRIIQEPDSGSTLFNVMEYYQNGKRKTLGKVSEFQRGLKYEGAQIRYFKNGNKSEITTFENGKPVGERYEYYENGKLKKTYINEPTNDQPDILNSKYRLISFFDSTGVQLVKDGTGQFREENFKTGWVENGHYLNGFKDSIWTGSSSKDDFWYKEKYVKGKLVYGQSRKQGIEYTYNEPETMPNYPTGLANFYKFIGSKYRYPSEASKRGVSGRVLITFVVEKDGSLVDFKVIKDLGYGTGEQAIAVLKKSSKWHPGKQHGVPVRVQFTLPLMLQLPR